MPGNTEPLLGGEKSVDQIVIPTPTCIKSSAVQELNFKKLCQLKVSSQRYARHFSKRYYSWKVIRVSPWQVT